MEDQEYSIEERITFALQWLGFEEVEIGKKFSTENFKKGEEVIIKEITYNRTDGIIPEPIAKNLATLLSGILNMHTVEPILKQRIEDNKEALENKKKLFDKNKELAAEVGIEEVNVENITELPKGYEEINIEDIQIEEMKGE